jgi:hypothetical protein
VPTAGVRKCRASHSPPIWSRSPSQAGLYGALGVQIAHAEPVGARPGMPTQKSVDPRTSGMGSYGSGRGEMVNVDTARPHVLPLMGNNPSVAKNTSKPGRHTGKPGKHTSKHRRHCPRRKTPHKHPLHCVKSHVSNYNEFAFTVPGSGRIIFARSVGAYYQSL